MAKPGLLRVLVGAFVFVGAAGALDQATLGQAPVSTALLFSSAVMIWRGARRMELGRQAQAPEPVRLPRMELSPKVTAPQPIRAPRVETVRLNYRQVPA